jgi:hypothetical protein
MTTAAAVITKATFISIPPLFKNGRLLKARGRQHDVVCNSIDSGQARFQIK